MSKVYDVSMPIRPEMPVYKNKVEKRPKLDIVSDYPLQQARETRITMDLHTGTHIDAPLHLIEGGSTMDVYHLDQFYGVCRVLDLTGTAEAIFARDLAQHPIEPGSFILLKTANSFSDIFDPNFVYLAGEGAEYLCAAGVKGVGIDSVGIERNQPDHETHKNLFTHGIMIIEGLRLADVPEGEYFMIALPLLIPGVEAAPARVILVNEGFGVV